MFRNNNSNTVTRFIGLGNFFNTSKQKWLYGFVLSPSEIAPTIKVDYTVTESPYANQSQYVANALPASNQYFYNTSTNRNYNNGPPKKKKYTSQKINQCE